MMNNNFICESAHISELDPVFDGVPIALKRHDDVDLRHVMSNTFGLVGQMLP